VGNRFRSFFSRNSALLGPLALIMILLIIAGLGKEYIADAVLLFEDVVTRSGRLGQVLFVSIFFLAGLCGIFPLSVLAILGGAAYGLMAGFFLSTAGLFLSASGAFLLGRYVLRSNIDRWLANRVSLSRLDNEIGAQGWKIVGLLRLSPLAPFSISSYAFSMTRISFRAYLVGTIATLPSLFAYVYMGSISEIALHAFLLGELEFDAAQLTIMGAGFIATVVLALFLVRIARKALSDG
jgi:uncharacterized membrane protein YdjX (TVP38/TMEM64 family)